MGKKKVITEEENHLNQLGIALGEVNENAGFKSTNRGDEQLIPMKDWILPDEMNTDESVLKHPIFDIAFDRILEDWIPKHNIAFMSLCTATRPYSKSNKYKVFNETFGNEVDFIVVSNGGFIPPKYWNSFPFLNYDAYHDPSGDWDLLYQEKMFDRIKKFFTKFNYEYVVANFRPSMRNYKPANEGLQLMKNEGKIKDFVVVPNEELYLKAKADGFAGEDVKRRKEEAKKKGKKLTIAEMKPNGCGNIFPDLHKFVLAELDRNVKKWSTYKDPMNELF